MPEFSGTVLNILWAREAPDQGGLLTGKDPSSYNPADPLRLWIIQVGVIVGATQILSLGLRKIRQPKVIAEVIGGILLGPTAFGRIPGFTEHVFPASSIPFLSLTANIGLVLFLFLVGLEIDSAIIKRNARQSLTVALPGMVLPFGLGAALAVPLYHHFIDRNVQFTEFMLFTGVAYSITAFPVLCRILTELKLLDTTVGITVLSAGVGNDIVGWTLLALSVALVNAGSGLTALWILMICLAWAVFLIILGKRALAWLARHTGSTQNGPTMFFMTITILCVFASAFFTDVIGVHAIFGAFLMGIIVPREGGLAIALTEKLEDMVSIIFLPLYFTLSGLSTNLGLLDNGITWAFTIAICALAFSGKFGGCALGARYAGFSWREACTVGAFMSCKGLVELIVLNVGLSAGILSQRVFSMFVLEALTLTFMTTPLVTALYPLEKRRRVAGAGSNFDSIHISTGEPSPDSTLKDGGEQGHYTKTRFTVVLDKIDHLPGMMALTQLLQSHVDNSPGLFIDALRLIELSDRTSAVMKSSVADTLLHTDPLLAIFRTFGELHDLPVSISLSVDPFDDLAYSVAEHARGNASQLILLPWLPPSMPGIAANDGTATPKATPSPGINPFDALFKSTSKDMPAHALHSQFVRGVFSQSRIDAALYIDQGHVPGGIKSRHIFLPFFGGPDDRLALQFVVQLCANPDISASIVRVTKKDFESSITANAEPAHLGPIRTGDELGLSVASAAGFQDTIYGRENTQMRMQSETADNTTWNFFAAQRSDQRNATTICALSRIRFSEAGSPIPLHTALQQVTTLEGAKRRVLVVAGRSKRLAVEDHHGELKELMDQYGHVAHEVRKTIGDVASAFVAARRGTAVIVVQAALLPLD